MPVYEFGPLRLEAENHALTCNGEPVPLPPRLFEILLTLVEGDGKVVSQEELRNHVWPESFVEDAAVIKNVSTLRAALRACLADTQIIRTLPKRGYQLVLPVTVVGDSSALSESLVVVAPPQESSSAVQQTDDCGSDPAAEASEPSAASAGELELAEPSGNPALGPDRSRRDVKSLARRRMPPRWYVAAAAMLLLAAGAILTARHASSGRPVVAVLQLHNLTPDASEDWIGVSVEESLRSNLERDHGARALTSLQVAEAERDLPAVSTGVYDKAQIQAFGLRLHCDYVVTGFYTTAGNELRLDLQMRNAATGDVRSAIQVQSPTAMLFARSREIADQLRAALGRPALGTPPAGLAQEQAQDQIQARDFVLPAYWEGLRLLRQDRYIEATEMLSRAVAMSPQSPLVHIALAGALKQMGYEGRAAEEARVAVQFSGSLPHEEHLRISALASEYQTDWKSSAAAYMELRALDPGNGDYVLGADRALISMGRLQEAATDLAGFTQSNPAAGADARFSLLRASAAAALTDHHSELVFAGDALRLARASSARHLEAQALIREGWAWAFFGDERKAETEAQQALTVAEANGNIPDILAASSELGQVQFSFQDPRARGTLQHALDIAQRAGARMAQSSLLVALGNIAVDDENYIGERNYNQQALDITLSCGLLTAQLPELTNLAEAAEGLGDFAADRKYSERVIAISEATGNRESLNYAYLALTRLAVRADDLPLAHTELAAAVKNAIDMDSKEQIAEALQATAQLALKEGDIVQARQLADRVTAMHVVVMYRIVQQKLLLGEVELREGHFDAAIQRVKEPAVSPAITVYPASAAWRIIAEANLLKGNLSDAATAVDKAVASARHAADPAGDLVPALLLRARIEKACRKISASGASIYEAATLARRADAPRALREVRSLKL